MSSYAKYANPILGPFYYEGPLKLEHISVILKLRTKPVTAWGVLGHPLQGRKELKPSSSSSSSSTSYFIYIYIYIYRERERERERERFLIEKEE